MKPTVNDDKNSLTRGRLLTLGLRLCLVIVALVVGSSATVWGQQDDATPDAAPAALSQPQLEFIVPQQVQLEQPILIALHIHGAENLAGFETALLFDSDFAEFGGVLQRQNDLRSQGRAVEPLAAIDLPGGVAFGFYSCASADCVTQTEPVQARGGRGSLHLATVKMVPRQEGFLTLTFDALKFVDIDGNPIDVALPQTSVTVQVGEPAPEARIAAPMSMWTLSAAPAGDSAVQQPDQFDFNRDGRINYVDVAEVAIEWQLARLDGNPCGELDDPSRDVNHDGCVDVADLQITASQVGVDLAGVERSSDATGAVTFVVTATTDGADANIGDGICATAFGVCTLRAAIEEANVTPDVVNIHFNIAGSGVRKIQLKGRLPTINNTSGSIWIDGYSQPGSQPNTDPTVSNAVILVEVVGNGEGAHDGFVITSANHRMRGLAIYNLRRELWIYGSGVSNLVIAGNFIGTNAAGTYASPEIVNNSSGIQLEQGAHNNQIGGPNPPQRNVISGNGQSGIGIFHEGSDANVIQGNIMGLNPAGTARLPNRRHAVDLNFGSSDNLVGGYEPGERNITSGNDYSGVEVSHTEATTGNRIINNFIGTDPSGEAAPWWSYNGYTGITLEDGVQGNLVEGNVIGNSRQGGLQLTGWNTWHNKIYSNWIGVSPGGNALPNQLFGARLDARYTQFGPDNVVANSQFSGIVIREADKRFNTITRNSIYNNGGLGIELLPNGVNANDPGDTDTGPNDLLNYPVINSANLNEVSGTACANCIVEIFVADGGAADHGEGRTFVGSGQAGPTGAFVVAITGILDGAFVTATATDGEGNTSEFARNVKVEGNIATPTPTATATPVPVTPEPECTPVPSTAGLQAADSFCRSSASGWGAAEVGGLYSLLWGTDAPADFSVNGSAGIITHQGAGYGREAVPQKAWLQHTDITFRIQTDRRPTTEQHILFMARRVDAGTMYRGRLSFDPYGFIKLQANKANNGQWYAFPTVAAPPDVVHVPGQSIWLRAQVIGANPTTLRMKVWMDGATEPVDWAYTVTDSDPGLQTAGGVGLRTSLLPGETNLPTLFVFDDLRVTSVDEPTVRDVQKLTEGMPDTQAVPIPADGDVHFLPNIQQ